ncbi:MAG: MotA/TolQ/ExbB proton channel family protein, partial [Paraburkholderia sp.]
MQNYGLAHVWAQGDFVTRGIALALLIMSVLSWSVIVIKGWNVMRLKRLTKNAEQSFWHSDDLSDGVQKLGADASSPQDNPFLAL